MHSTEYLLIQYVVCTASSEDAEALITTDYGGAIDILRAAGQMINECEFDIEDIND